MQTQAEVEHNVECPWCNDPNTPSAPEFCKRELVRFTRKLGQLQEWDKYGKAIKIFFEALAGLEVAKEVEPWQ